MKKLIIGAAAVVGILGLSGCASWESAAKDHQSNTTGLNRKVLVLNEDGDVIRKYEGLIRIKDTDVGGKVVFELNGKRIALYNATVITEEK